MYYAIAAVDKAGNIGAMSNVVKSLVQDSRSLSHNELKMDTKGGIASEAAASSAEYSPDYTANGTLLDVEKPSTILFYLIAGIVGFIIICGFIVMVILVAFRRRRRKKDPSLDEEDLGSNGSSGGFGENPPASMLEIAGMDPETKHFLLGSSNQDSALMVGPTHSSLIKVISKIRGTSGFASTHVVVSVRHPITY